MSNYLYLSGYTYTIQSVHSGKFLNAAGNGKSNGVQARVKLFAPPTTFAPTKHFPFQIGTNVHQWDNPQHNATQWIIRPADEAATSMQQPRFDSSRRYTIENRHARGKYLNVFGASFDNGANLIVRSA